MPLAGARPGLRGGERAPETGDGPIVDALRFHDARIPLLGRREIAAVCEHLVAGLLDLTRRSMAGHHRSLSGLVLDAGGPRSSIHTIGQTINNIWTTVPPTTYGASDTLCAQLGVRHLDGDLVQAAKEVATT